MRFSSKRSFFAVCKYIGVFALFRFFNRRKLLILTYHSVVSVIPSGGDNFDYRNCVSIDQFSAQLIFLLQKYRLLQPEQIANHFSQSENRQRNFLITFDDGFRNNYTRAFPLLKEKQIPAIFFVTTGYLDTGGMLWTEKVIYLILHTRREALHLEMGKPVVIKITTLEEKLDACQKIRAFLKRSKKEKILKTVERLEDQLDDVNLKGLPKERYEFLTWKETKELKDSGMTIGSHTKNHMILSSLSDGEVEHELQESKDIIEKKIGSSCEYFSYPNGTSEDFNADHKLMLKRLGYRYAFSQVSSLNGIGEDSFALKRINITDQMDLLAFEAYISGFIPTIKTFLHRVTELFARNSQSKNELDHL